MGAIESERPEPPQKRCRQVHHREERQVNVPGQAAADDQREVNPPADDPWRLAAARGGGGGGHLRADTDYNSACQKISHSLSNKRSNASPAICRRSATTTPAPSPPRMPGRKKKSSAT